jgi:fatty acid desaturase
MQTTLPAPSEVLSTDLQSRVNALRRTDNWTNWFYLAREYLFLGTVAALAILFYQYRAAWGLDWVWNVPVTLLAVALIGIGQHRLITLGHEASHYILFRNRWLNELASDWLCMFPVFSVTHNYRLQHLAHHQFVNDPQRDPDLQFMEASGTNYRFPMSRGRFLWECIVKRFLWLPGIISYLRVRLRYTTAAGDGPYSSKSPRSRLLVLIGVLYLLTLVVTLNLLAYLQQPLLLAVIPAVLLVAVLTFYILIPERLYPQTLVRPIISPRWWTVQRMIYLTLLFNTLAWLTYLTGEFWGVYYLLLWALPLTTVFPFLMILREEVQHGDADRGRFTSTRNVRGGWLMCFAAFPLGMDYHLPHHLFPMVPHYRLRQLHDLLEEEEGYRREAVVVNGYSPAEPAATL